MKKKRNILVLLGLVICLSSLLPASAQSDSTEILLQRARTLERRGRLDLAAKAWKQILLSHPNTPEALAGLSRYDEQLGNTEEAQKLLGQARKLGYEIEKSAAASDKTQLVNASPDLTVDQKAKLQEAARLSSEKKPEESMKIYREVFGEHPPEGSLSIAYYETLASISGESATAISHLRELTKRYPDDEGYKVALGRLLTYTPRTRFEGVRELESVDSDFASIDAARLAWRQALVWEKGNPAYESSLRSYLKRFNDSSLEQEFGPLQPTRSSAEIVRDKEEAAAYKALQQGDLESAENLFERLRSGSPENSKALAGLGFVRMKQEHFAEALELLELAKTHSAKRDKALDQAIDTARFWNSMQNATQFLASNKLEEAARNFQESLQLRPENAEAIRGMAGTLMKQGQYAEAITYYKKLFQQNSNDVEIWKDYLQALHQSGDVEGSIVAAKNMPAAVRTAASGDPEFLVILAAAYDAQGNTAQSRQLLKHAIELAEKTNTTSGTQMQMAALLGQARMIEQATQMYVRLLDDDPQNLTIWQGLIAALHASDKDQQALSVSLRMPRNLFERAVQKSDFLMLMAAVYQSQEQTQTAHRFLEQAVQQESAQGHDVPAALQLQVAGLWLKEKDYSKAIDLYEQLIQRNPENIDAWRGKLSALHAAHRDDQIIGLILSADSSVQDRLQNDPVVLGLLASAHAAEGETELALQLIQRATWQYQSRRKPLPTDLQIQSCWILFNTGEEASLHSELRLLSARTDLTQDQRKSVQEIWSTWSLRRAETLASSNDFKGALTILYTVRKVYPDDPKIQSSFANMLLRGGYPRRSFDEYYAWGLAGGAQADYAAAISAAVAVREYKVGEAWLKSGLKQWEDDPKLLLVGAKLYAARGDYSRANKYYQSARAALPSNQNNLPWASAADTDGTGAQAVRDLAQLLAPEDTGGTSTHQRTRSGKQDGLDALLQSLPGSTSNHRVVNPGRSLPLANEWTRDSFNENKSPSRSHAEADTDSFLENPRSTYHTTGEQRPVESSASLDWLFRPSPSSNMLDAKVSSKVSRNDPPQSSQSKDYDFLSSEQSSYSDADSDPVIAHNSPGTLKHNIASPRDEIQSEVNAAYAQFSPYAGMKGVVSGRAGQTGFDHLIAQETDVEASTTIANTVRVTAIARPVVLDAGSPDKQTTLQLGTLPLGNSFGAMGASGLGGELQIATQNFGASFGTTPQGFLVQNFIGSIQLRPGGGPFLVSASREPIRDTLLSYAGIRDPGTGQIWGGVIANQLSGLGSWGTAQSGFYAGLGYQYITGENVPNNKRIDGTAGTYWKVWDQPYGSLTLGLNFSALHYDKNLRYFTLGQGGYFSPQSYFLFNIPIHWRGTYQKRFEYSIDASLGSQHFEEDATLYFPLSVQQSAQSSNLTSNLAIGTFPLTPPPPPSYYPSQVSTSANYNMSMKGGYRLAENWYLGGFLDLNNTRNYSSTSIGFYVRYQPRPIPLDAPIGQGTLLEWNSIRPLLLP